MIALALIPLAIIAVQAWLWHRELRLRATDKWRRERLVAFLKRDLPSTCDHYGHEVDEFGCAWCGDLEPMWAHYSVSEYIHLDPEGDPKTVVASDPRIAGFTQLGWRYSDQKGATGIAWIDRSAPRPYPSEDLPATTIAEQRQPQYTSLHGNQAPQVTPQGGSRRTERGAPSREAADWIRSTQDQFHARKR
jgi:hypothetical protein